MDAAQMDAPPTKSLVDWAVAEALRLVTTRKGAEKEAAAIAAARRAPGLQAAACALKRLSLVTGDALLQAAIPQSVRDEVAAEKPSVDEKVVSRVDKWLRAAPYELTRAKSATAAIAAACPVALLQTQQIDAPRNEELEAACRTALDKHSSRRLHAARVHRTSHADAVSSGTKRPRAPRRDGSRRLRRVGTM
jgi:hypothetical protein